MSDAPEEAESRTDHGRENVEAFCVERGRQVLARSESKQSRVRSAAGVAAVLSGAP